MSRVLAYCRISTTDHPAENQHQEILAAGFLVEPRRLIEEAISGSVAAQTRPGFSKLLNRIEGGDILVVTKLDRLGRNAMDVRQTIEALEHVGVHVHCLALGGMDLTGPVGKLLMQVIAAVAEFERDLLIERTQAGLARARVAGKRFGRPPALGDDQRTSVMELLAAGVSVSELARKFQTTRQTIMRAREAALKIHAKSARTN
jgi:putative DNA-invertase from lambdoid prophage Rac